MARVLLALLVVALYLSFIIDVIRTPKTAVRTLPKVLWLLVVIVLPIIGGVLWLILGRQRRQPGPWFRRRKPSAPDDDPAFLRSLEEEAWKRRMRERRGEPGT